MPEWIAWQLGTGRKPEVARIAGNLRVSRREAAMMCLEVWEWADQNTTDGCVHNVSPEELSELVGVPGIAEAMVGVGWLRIVDDGLEFSNFQRWNGETGKARLQAARRQQRRRAESR